MLAHKKSKKFDPEEDKTAYFEQEFKICPRCKQEYTGTCPISCASCPMEADESAAEDEDDEGKKDFDDIEHLGEVLDEDKDADRLTEEEDEIPERDLREKGRQPSRRVVGKAHAR
jgi:hypothetical protein